jgi:GxxExxY protein
VAGRLYTEGNGHGGLARRQPGPCRHLQRIHSEPVQIKEENPQIAQIMTDKYPLSELTYAIIGAAMEVHRELGSGFLEAVYHEALAIELTRRNLPFFSEPQIDIYYKDIILPKKYNPDFLVSGEVVVEIKALSKLTSTEDSQIINALKASRKKVGLLINFGTASLEFKRFINEKGKVAFAKEQ